jgi:hypothetical protein
MVVELVTAPKGYEDENGFHYGTPPPMDLKKDLRKSINLN